MEITTSEKSKTIYITGRGFITLQPMGHSRGLGGMVRQMGWASVSTLWVISTLGYTRMGAGMAKEWINI